jgi:hypothetical protein
MLGVDMGLRGHVARRLVATLAVGLLAVGCSASPEEPAVTPTAVATPPETQLERQTRLDFEAAEKSYRAFVAEYDRLSRAGGATTATSAMERYGAGPYLDTMVDFLSQTKARKVRSRGQFQIGYVRPGLHTPTELTLNVCEDGTGISNVDSKGKVVSKGLAGKLTLQMRLIDNRWKVWDGSDEDVASCDA